jgi:hypothetical protein
MKSPTLSKRSGPGLTWARHCRTRPLPAPTLGLTGSGSRLRAPPHDGSMTARSPSGKRRPPVSSHTAAPPLPANRRADHRSHSLDFGGEERRGETEMMLGFRGGAVVPRFCSHERCAPPFITDGRSATFWA